jgi:hypothetical protein
MTPNEILMELGFSNPRDAVLMRRLTKSEAACRPLTAKMGQAEWRVSVVPSSPHSACYQSYTMFVHVQLPRRNDGVKCRALRRCGRGKCPEIPHRSGLRECPETPQSIFLNSLGFAECLHALQGARILRGTGKMKSRAVDTAPFRLWGLAKSSAAFLPARFA